MSTTSITAGLAHELSERKEFAIELAKAAGSMALDFARKAELDVQIKDSGEPVTEADKSIESLVRTEILRSFPQDSILGEEQGGALGSLTWVIDPIDGTNNYRRGLGYWCISLALMVDEEPCLGVVLDAKLSELFVAVRGQGAYCNGEKLAVSRQKGVRGSFVGLGLTKRAEPLATLSAISDLLAQGASLRMFGAAALSLAHVSAGRMDGFFEARVHIWDCAAGCVLVKEAGGWCDVLYDTTKPLAQFPIAAGTSALRGRLVNVMDLRC